MKPIRSLAALFLVAFIMSALGLAQESQTEFRVEPLAPEALIGDRVLVYLRSTPETRSDQILNIEFNADPERWHQSEPWLPPNERKTADSTAWSATLQPFETGVIPLPKARISYRLSDGTIAEALTTTTTLTVKSAMQTAIAAAPGQPEELPGLLGPKPIYKFPRDWRGPALAAAGVLAALALAYLLYRRMRARPKIAPPAPAEPPLAPGPWALREIDLRRALPVSNTGPAKEIASLASEVVRIYITRRFDFLALDRTSYECLQVLAKLGLNASARDLLHRFFADCDFAKFTKHDLPRERWTTLWDDARDFVLATTPAHELQPVAVTAAEPQLTGAPTR